jgi:hypothetical protein
MTFIRVFQHPSGKDAFKIDVSPLASQDPYSSYVNDQILLHCITFYSKELNLDVSTMDQTKLSLIPFETNLSGSNASRSLKEFSLTGGYYEIRSTNTKGEDVDRYSVLDSRLKEMETKVNDLTESNYNLERKVNDLSADVKNLVNGQLKMLGSINIVAQNLDKVAKDTEKQLKNYMDERGLQLE